MASMDIFNSSAFSMTSLTGAVNKVDIRNAASLARVWG